MLSSLLNVFFHHSIQSRGCHVQCIQRRRSRNSLITQNSWVFLKYSFFFFFIYFLLFVCFNQLRWYTYTKDFLEESICCDGPYHVYNSLNYDVMDMLKTWWFYIILSKSVMWWYYRTVIVTFFFFNYNQNSTHYLPSLIVNKYNMSILIIFVATKSSIF